MANDAFTQLFGYSPIDEFAQIPAWKKSRRSSISPLVDAQIGYISQQETNKANAELARSQNEYNLEMWNKQNEYNSPSATMQRLVDAGINPRAYQQIGQFANASQPHQAERPDYESPIGKLAKFAEKAQIDMAIRSQKLNSIRLSKDIALETAEKIRAYRVLDETKRHNLATENISQLRAEETQRHNMAVEAVENISLMMEDSKFRLALEKSGITRNSDGSFNIPATDIRLEERERNRIIENLIKSGYKLVTENDYLELKKDLEAVNTGNKVFDSILKLIVKIL